MSSSPNRSVRHAADHGPNAPRGLDADYRRKPRNQRLRHCNFPRHLARKQ
jgi:hypothetical protein